MEKVKRCRTNSCHQIELPNIHQSQHLLEMNSEWLGLFKFDTSFFSLSLNF